MPRKTRQAKVVYNPHPGQWRFHEAVDERNEDGSRKYKFFVLNNGRRWGKDRACANQFIKTFTDLDNRPPDETRVPHTHGWVVAPTFPLASQMWRELKAFWPKDLIKRVDNNKMELETNRGGIVEVRSAHDPETLVSVGLDVLWVTEGARVREAAWNNMRPMLNSPGREGILFLNSTPKGRNWFARAYWFGQETGPDGLPNQNRVPKWWSMTAPTLQNEYLSEEQRQEIENARLELPEDVYAQEYEARILDNGATVFRNIRSSIRGSLLPGPARGRTYVIGVDLAKLRDFTEIVVMDRDSKQVVHYERFNQLNWEVQMDRVVLVTRQWRAVKVMLDSTGLGEPIVDMLKRRLGRMTVEGYQIGSNRAKIDLIQPLQAAIEHGELGIPNIRELVHQLEVYEYEIKESGAWTYNAPEGETDDGVIALALAWRASSSVTKILQQGKKALYSGRGY